MNILMNRTGKFIFMNDKYEVITFTDYNQIPKDFIIKEIITFLPDIPPPPHTVQQHEEIHLWDLEFKKLLEKTYATSYTSR